LNMAAKILKFDGDKPLVMADNEHYTAELLDWIRSTSPYDLLVPMPKKKLFEAQLSRWLSKHLPGIGPAMRPQKVLTK